jgi:hypothetical protein
MWRSETRSTPLSTSLEGFECSSSDHTGRCTGVFLKWHRAPAARSMAHDTKATAHLSQRARHIRVLSMYAHGAYAERQHDQHRAKDQHDRRSGATSVPHHLSETSASRHAGSVNLYAFAGGVSREANGRVTTESQRRPRIDASVLASDDRDSNSLDSVTREDAECAQRSAEPNDQRTACDKWSAAGRPYTWRAMSSAPDIWTME